MKKLFIAVLVLIALGIAQEIGARYLIITHDNFYNAILPYAQWKHKMGYRTKIVQVPSELAQNSTAIRNYILNAYNSWQIRPEFILLVGAPNYIPWSMSSLICYSDNNYTNMIGTVENEILSGRLTVHNPTEAQTVVNKMLLYERYPDTNTVNWFVNACLIVNEDDDPYDDSIYWSDIRHAKNLMLQNGYNTIDTLSRTLGNDKDDVIARVNQGRGFVLYRGQGISNWWSPFDVNPALTSNGTKLPIVLSITCITIGTGATPAIAEKWLLTGTPTTPRGGAGYFATTTTVIDQAYLRSAVCKGFFDALFVNRKMTFGEACERGRLRAYHLYGDIDEYRGFTTLGDPAMQIWTAKPKPITVLHDTLLYGGAEETLNVNVSYQGTPIESAFVCILLDTLIYRTGYTDADGEVGFIFTPPVSGSMEITVTGRNLYPYEGVIQVIMGDVYLIYLNNIINDTLGNNNGVVNNGETILLYANLRNLGSTPALGVKATLRTTDPDIVPSDSISLFGNILPGNEQIGLNPFVFSVSPDAVTHPIPFEILITDAQADTFTGSFSVMVTGIGGGIGPDPYGYYIYDDTDTLTGNAPVYDWFEIAPPGPGLIVSEITDEDADTVTYPLLFNFPYYGITYNTIGLCSNGFLELGGATYRLGENTTVPHSGGPRRLIAPFWDDLDLRPSPSGYGEVYYYNDTENHRWIVEFKESAHYGNASARETFQVILLDPQYYPTPTGDGEILFLYKTVNDADENTVGIEDETEMRGLQYVFNNNYDPNAVPLVNGRALLITTKPPAGEHSPWLNLLSYTINDSAGGNNNGIPEPNETVEITLFISNDGDTIVTGVNGTIRTNSLSVSLIDSIADFGDIDIGGAGNNISNPYIIQIAENPIDTLVGIVVFLAGNNETYQTYTYFTLHIHDETGINETDLRFAHYTLPSLQVYPNPFRNHLVIYYGLGTKHYAPDKIVSSAYSIVPTIRIYDATGRLVKNFFCLMFNVEPSTILWDGTDDSGRRLPAGVYFVRLNCPIKAVIQKVVKLK